MVSGVNEARVMVRRGLKQVVPPSSKLAGRAVDHHRPLCAGPEA